MILGTSGTSFHASTVPMMPAITLTSTLSKTKSRKTLVREAPSAIRNAISRLRPLKRTSNRLATLLQAMSKTNPTAASKVVKPDADSRHIFRQLFTDVNPWLSILSGNCML